MGSAAPSTALSSLQRVAKTQRFLCGALNMLTLMKQWRKARRGFAGIGSKAASYNYCLRPLKRSTSTAVARPRIAFSRRMIWQHVKIDSPSLWKSLLWSLGQRAALMWWAVASTVHILAPCMVTRLSGLPLPRWQAQTVASRIIWCSTKRAFLAAWPQGSSGPFLMTIMGLPSR